jgi:hypothetical protein
MIDLVFKNLSVFVEVGWHQLAGSVAQAFRESQCGHPIQVFPIASGTPLPAVEGFRTVEVSCNDGGVVGG